MSNFNLPDGCSVSDIDHWAGEYGVLCIRCGDLFQAHQLNEDGLCRHCAEREEQE